MARGADRAILVQTSLRADQLLQPLVVAKILKALADREKPDIVILGKQVSGALGQNAALP